ncbi:pseudaminic acid synthase [Helicobacter sp. MIT 14-3879]|uniref:pseudaminic acid synthase n=1 Tax=Helicobacter sp. MIT 14-3879 TaxID=2040649 RepID=UPI0021620D82|nr:pseudaminic acid synthase [Helicobacter sp. MIT 14-3879]
MGIFIVAELSANHNQNLSLAKESIYAIKECGADAIKLQTYTPDSLTLECRSDIFKINSNTIWDNKYLYDLYKEAYMPLEWNYELFSIARKIGLFCFSSAFDKEGVDLLESINNPIYKIASFEITDTNLISYIASKNKPIILSSGIANNNELDDAIECIITQNNYDITLLKCTSAYPAKTSELNLIDMVNDAKRLERKYKIKIKYGLSDHSKGNLASIIATTLKASVIEKHFILDKKYGGVDSKFSLNKTQFTKLVKIIRESEAALKNNNFLKYKNRKKGREFARSLFVCKDIKKGDKLTLENIKSVRPNNGLSPKYLKDIINKTALRDLEFGKPLEWEDFS